MRQAVPADFAFFSAAILSFRTSAPGLRRPMSSASSCHAPKFRLASNCAGRLDVEFIDVWKNGDAGEKYGIRVIPTQIFISAEGKELFRHEGFFSKEDILAKWKEFGVELTR